jgi:hypothetical protein
VLDTNKDGFLNEAELADRSENATYYIQTYDLDKNNVLNLDEYKNSHEEFLDIGRLQKTEAAEAAQAAADAAAEAAQAAADAAEAAK